MASLGPCQISRGSFFWYFLLKNNKLFSEKVDIAIMAFCGVIGGQNSALEQNEGIFFA